MSTRAYALVVVTLILALLALWETRYSYLPLPSDSVFKEIGYAVRVNRFTGRVQVFLAGNGNGEWLDLSSAQQKPDAAKR